MSRNKGRTEVVTVPLEETLKFCALVRRVRSYMWLGLAWDNRSRNGECIEALRKAEGNLLALASSGAGRDLQYGPRGIPQRARRVTYYDRRRVQSMAAGQAQADDRDLLAEAIAAEHAAEGLAASRHALEQARAALARAEAALAAANLHTDHQPETMQ